MQNLDFLDNCEHCEHFSENLNLFGNFHVTSAFFTILFTKFRFFRVKFMKNCSRTSEGAWKTRNFSFFHTASPNFIKFSRFQHEFHLNHPKKSSANKLYSIIISQNWKMIRYNHQIKFRFILKLAFKSFFIPFLYKYLTSQHKNVPKLLTEYQTKKTSSSSFKRFFIEFLLNFKITSKIHIKLFTL